MIHKPMHVFDMRVILSRRHYGGTVGVGRLIGQWRAVG